MPPPRDHLDQRLGAIREILATEEVRDQSQLVARLKRRRVSATQSGVSRDLRRLGAAKINGCYRITAGTSPSDADQLLREVAAQLVDTRPAGDNIVVVTTEIGAATRVALALDRAGRPEIVGTIAGDDSIFIATNGAGDQRRLLQFLSSLQGRRS